MAQEDPRKVLVMMSGGPDSSTLAKLIQSQERAAPVQINAIYLASGQPSDKQEIEAANKMLAEVGGKLEIIDLTDTLRALGGERILIHSEASILPFGNSIALSIAMSYAMKIGASRIYVGLHADDVEESAEYSRPFIDNIEANGKIGCPNAPTIETPFLAMSKIEVFRLGATLDVPYELTWSCIRNEDIHCGQCGACRGRRRAFVGAGIADPTAYRREPLALQTIGFGEAQVA